MQLSTVSGVSAQQETGEREPKSGRDGDVTTGRTYSGPEGVSAPPRERGGFLFSRSNRQRRAQPRRLCLLDPQQLSQRIILSGKQGAVNLILLPSEAVNGPQRSGQWAGEGTLAPFKPRFDPCNLQSGKEGTRTPTEPPSSALLLYLISFCGYRRQPQAPAERERLGGLQSPTRPTIGLKGGPPFPTRQPQGFLGPPTQALWTPQRPLASWLCLRTGAVARSDWRRVGVLGWRGVVGRCDRLETEAWGCRTLQTPGPLRLSLLPQRVECSHFTKREVEAEGAGGFVHCKKVNMTPQSLL